jgi:hypothetical protein
MNKSFNIDWILEEIEKVGKECAKEYKACAVLPPVYFVLSEVIIDESEALYTEAFTNASNKISNIESRLQGGDFTEKEPLDKKLASARARIMLMKGVYYFIYKTKAVSVSLGSLTVKQTWDAYKQRKPPFSNKKKCEFPDAYALFSLEKWRQSNKASIIVVSRDEDWEGFAESKKGWHFERDIATAIRKYYALCK